MRLSTGLRSFIRSISPNLTERRVLASAASKLIRKRRHALALFAPLLAVVSFRFLPKLSLWSHLASALLNCAWRSSASPRLLFSVLEATQAYKDSRCQIANLPSGTFIRGENYRLLLQAWRDCPPRRLLIFHHYDQRAILSSAWSEALQVIQADGWQVVLSTSALTSESVRFLKNNNVQIALRSNVGLCLGAYRDLCCLVSDPQASRSLNSLVLCNDSTLPLCSPTVLLSQLQNWSMAEEDSLEPVLAGLTDSVERNSYHLQSYFLYANRALLNLCAWQGFWQTFSVVGNKDSLIDRGEIGLSQALLAAGVRLSAAYPLVEGLLLDPRLAHELDHYNVNHLCDLNQSLHAWQSLLARGFPLIKKHVLFSMTKNKGFRFALSELSDWIPKDRYELFASDLHQLLISRYSSFVDGSS